MSKKRIYGLPMAGSSNDPRRPLEIPIDAHPDAVKGDSPLLEPARAAQKAVYDVWTKVRAAQTNVADKQKLADVAKRAVERSLAVADQKLERLHQSRQTVAAQIDGVVRPKAPDSVASEIRTYMQGRKEAFTTLAQSIQKGDRRTVAAVLTAPAYLSGLTDNQYGTLLEMAQKVFCPEETQTVADLDRAIARVERSTEQLTTVMAPLVRQWRGNDDKALEELQNHAK